MRRKLLHTPFVRTETTQSEVYRNPEEVYVKNQETELYFKGNPDVAFVTRKYPDSFVDMLIKELKIRNKPHVECCRNPQPGGYIPVISRHGRHERGLRGFDPRAQADGLEHALKHPTLERSTYIWREIAIPHMKQIHGRVEMSTKMTFADSGEFPEHSPFGRMLKKCPWLPKPTGVFSLPKDISLDELPEDFRRDMEGESSGLAQKLGMKDSNPSSELDGKFPKDVIKFAEDLKKLSPEDKKRMREYLDHVKNIGKSNGFPTDRVADEETRRERARMEAKSQQLKPSKGAMHSVTPAIGQSEAKAYLLSRYRDDQGDIRCQLCHQKMPFRGRDGKSYFSAVEFVNKIKHEHPSAHGAFCPVCEAKWKEFVRREPSRKQERQFLTDIARADSTTLSFSLSFDSQCMSLRFTEKHLIDFREVVRYEFPDAAD